MTKQKVIIFKVLKRATPVSRYVWCETNFGVIKKPLTSIPSIAVAAFEERERQELHAQEANRPWCNCKAPKASSKLCKVCGEHCVTCGGRMLKKE